MTLTPHFNTSFNLIQKLEDEAGDPVTGATVTVTIEDPDGNELVTDATMVDQNDGTYVYAVAEDLLSERQVEYMAKITAVDGSGNQAYSEIRLYTLIDTS